jgi:hypothetical protein
MFCSSPQTDARKFLDTLWQLAQGDVIRRGNEGKRKKALVVRHYPRCIFNGLVSVASGAEETWPQFKNCVLVDMLVFWMI